MRVTLEHDQLPASTSAGSSIDDSTGIKVLCVDDDVSLLELAKLFLASNDKRLVVETTTSATAALQKLEEETHDVIVSDYKMPGMSGLEFLERLRSEKNKIPFILFTGSGEEEIAIQALHHGASHYIPKSGDPVSLYGILAQAIVSEVKHC